MSALYVHKNLAFIGTQGVGKTHLAMAYGIKINHRTIYEGIFVAVINGYQSKNSIFDGDIFQLSLLDE